MDKKGITRILTGMLFLSPLVSEAWKYSTYVEEIRSNWKFIDKVKDWGGNPIAADTEDKDVYEGSKSVVISKPEAFAIFSADDKYEKDRQMWLAEQSAEGAAKGLNYDLDTVSMGTKFTYYKHPTIYISKDDPAKCSMDAAFYDHNANIWKDNNVTIWLTQDQLGAGASVTLPAAPLFFPLSTKGKVGDAPMSKLVFDDATRNAFTARADEPCLDFSNTPIVHIDLGAGKATYNSEEIDAQRSMEFYMLPSEASEWYFHPAMALHHAGLLKEEFSPEEYKFSISNDMTPDGIKTWPSNIDGMKGLVIDDGALTSTKCKAWALSKVQCSGKEVMTFTPSPKGEYHKGAGEGGFIDQLVGVEIQPEGNTLRTAVFYTGVDGKKKAFTTIHVFLPYDPAMAMIKKMCTGALPDSGKKFTELETYSEEMKAVAQVVNALKDDHGGALPANFENVITAMDNLSSIDVLALKAWGDIAKLSADDMLSAHEKYLKLKPENHGLDAFARAAVGKPTGIDWDDGWTCEDYEKTVKGKLNDKLKDVKEANVKTQAHNYVQFKLAINDLKRDKSDTKALKIAAKKLADLLGVKKPADGILTKADIEEGRTALKKAFDELRVLTKEDAFENALAVLNLEEGIDVKGAEEAIRKFLDENNCNKALTDQLNALIECYKANANINKSIDAVPDDVSALKGPSEAQKAFEDAQKKFDALKALLEKGGGKFEKKPAGGGGGGDAIDFSQLPADSDIKTKFDEFLGKADQKLKDAIAEINAKEITAKTDSAACVDGLDAKHSLPKDQLVKYVDFLKALKGYNDAKPITKPMMLGALKGKLDEFTDFKPEETHDEPVKIWTEAEIDAEIKKIKDACTAFRGKHSDLDAAIKASVEAEPAKSVDDYIAERKTALGDASDGAAITKLDQLKDQLDYYSMYKTCMDEAAKEDNKKTMKIPALPGEEAKEGPSLAQIQLELAKTNLTELAKLLGDTIDFGGSTGGGGGGGGTPTGDKVWTWTQIDANTSKFKADFQKFCDKLGEGNFKNAVTEINKLPWDDPFKGKERNDKINEILGKSGELKALLEKYVACKKEVHKLVMPPPPGAPEPTKKEGQQVAIEAAQENLKALAAHFKIDLGGGDDSGHHEPPPTGMTAETAKAEIANAENALKAAFGNDAAWENIANGTTIDWTTGDAAVQAAINLQPANLQPKLKAYYEYHKLMQEVLSATDADRKTKLEALQAKVDGWKATLSKKDAEDDGPIPDANPDWTEEQKKAYEHFKSRCVTETGDAGFHLLWMRQLKDAAAKVQDGTMRGILDVEAFNKTVQPFEETFKAFKNALRSAAKVSSEDFGANKNEKKWKELEAAWDASYKLCNEATKLFLLTEEQKGEIKGFKETFYGKGDDDKGTQAAWGESKAEIQKWNENPDHNFVIKDQKEIETKLIELDRWLGTTSANQVSNAFDYEKYKEKIKNHIQETKAALKGTRDDFEFAKMPPEVQDKVQPLKDLFKELGQSRQNIKLDAFTDDGIDEAFKGDFNANKGALEKALKTYDEMFQGIHSDWKKILDGDPTSITDDVLNGIQTRLNDAKTQLEDDKEGSLKDLMKKAQDAMEQAKKDTERAAENKKKMENFKKLGETLQSAIRSAAKVQHPTAFTDALDALDQYSKLFEKVRESTGKSVDTLFEEEWFTGGAAAIVATLQKVQEAVKNAVPIPQQGSSYSSGNPSLYQTYSGPTPRRNRRQSPSSRNEAYHSSSSDSKSGALSQREREREARRRAVYRRGGRVRN